MKVVVLHGSPKGKRSVTVQYVDYLAKRFADHHFETFPVAYEVVRYRRDEAYLERLLSAVDEADLILWSFPVYFLQVSSRYKEFIEYLFSSGAVNRFSGRFTAALSTSIHFYDHTAGNYIHAVSEDMGTYFLGSHSAEMHDLLSESKRIGLERWFSEVIRDVERNEKPGRAYPPVVPVEWIYAPARAGTTSGPGDGRSGDGVVIVSDPTTGNTAAMVERLRQFFPSAPVVDLSTMRIGPCLGCLKCGFDNVCAYEGTKDEFVPLYRETILNASTVIFAGAVHDRYLSYRWQRFLERTFVFTHQPRFAGKAIAFLVSGPLGHNHNAREVLLSWADTMGAEVAGIVTDEAGDGDALDRQIESLTVRLKETAAAAGKAAKQAGYSPKTFRGVAGMRVFRDEIFGELKFVFQADHRYYRRHGIYDFPHRKPMRFLAVLLIAVTRIPGLRSRIRGELATQMIVPFQKVVERAS